MESENGAFNQLQLTRTRSRKEVWRAEDFDGQSRRTSARQSVLSQAEQWSKSRRDSADTNRSVVSVTTRGEEVKRWDGIKRVTSPWEDLRQDPELWFDDGDCLVHFYARGTSRKGPSLRLFRDEIEDWGCRSVLSKFASQALIEEEEDSTGDEYADPSRGSGSREELHIPNPPLLGRDDAVKFHLTTRNLFALIYGRPIVGAHLGEALVLTHERLNQYRQDKERNRDDMLAYIEDQGYTEFRDHPDHAMGVLYYAEKLRDTDLWTEAFVHCVGMYDVLNTAIEFSTVSRGIGALITRAHLEMTLRLEHAFADLGNFMEDSVETAYPRLSEPILKHIGRFRSFLHTYYVGQHGYWPPPSLQPGSDYSIVTKSLLRTMYSDMRSLYAFLCDPKSAPKPTQSDIDSYTAVYGGICMPAVISAFDRRFKHTPLPNPLPLLPTSGAVSGHVSPLTAASNLAAMDLTTGQKPSSGGPFKRLLRSSRKKSMKALNILNQLSAASNTNDQSVMDSRLVQEYSRFERDWTISAEEKLDPVEGRKARWLLIYALLQTIVGVIVVPQEVAATENVEYPLCVQTAGTPPWRKRPKSKALMNGADTPQLEALSAASSRAASPARTPTTPGARSSATSGATSPISAAGEIPPVPQLILSELEKLQRRSFDSSKSGNRDDSSSVHSGNVLRKKNQMVKSSASSIRSTRSDRSTRSSFSAMLNRSLYMGPPPGSSLSVVSNAASQSTARQSQAPKDRPQLPKQKSSPAQIEHDLSVARTSRRGSIFGRMRSRNSSVAEIQPPAVPSVASSTSLAQSTFSQAKESPSEITPASSTSRQESSEKPQQAAPRLPRLSSLHPLDAAVEPERGRSTRTPHSPDAGTPTRHKVPNFSRGRSMERPKSASGVRPDTSEAAPPVPTTTKPRSSASSPARSLADENRTYTDARVPPPVPVNHSPVVSPVIGPPVVNQATKPRSRATSLLGEEKPPTTEDLPMPPPIPFSSKPNSRSASPHTARPAQVVAPQIPAVQQLPPIAVPAPKAEEYRGRSRAIEHDDSVTPAERRSRSRSLALRPAPPQPRPAVPALNTERPISNVSASSESGHRTHSHSVSPISADESPDSSAEALQRVVTNASQYEMAAQYQPQYQPHRSEPIQGNFEQHGPNSRGQKPPVPSRHGIPSQVMAASDGAAHGTWDNPKHGDFHVALREHDERRANTEKGRPRRGSSRESKHRRAAWAELGGGMRNEANGMPVPPPAVRQYGAPIVRDVPAKDYGYFKGTESEHAYRR